MPWAQPEKKKEKKKKDLGYLFILQIRRLRLRITEHLAQVTQEVTEN